MVQIDIRTEQPAYSSDYPCPFAYLLGVFLLLSPTMSLVRPHLPSPAPTPDEMQTSPAALEQPAEVNQTRLRADLEAQLLRLSQDLYEMEICAGEVGANMEEAVPNYLYLVLICWVPYWS